MSQLFGINGNFSSAATSIGTFDSQAGDAKGLVLAANVLYAQSATASVPGMVNTTTQTFAGLKTFNDSIYVKGNSAFGDSSDTSLAKIATNYTVTRGNTFLQDRAAYNYLDVTLSTNNTSGSSIVRGMENTCYLHTGVGKTYAGLVIGEYCAAAVDGSGSVALSVIGLEGQVFVNGTATVGTISGIVSYSAVNTGATVTDHIAVNVFGAQNLGTITNHYGIRLSDPSGGTITNNYGLHIQDQTVGTNIYGIYSNVSSGSTKWNIYIPGTAKNYFAGQTEIGSGSQFTVSSTGYLTQTISQTLGNTGYTTSGITLTNTITQSAANTNNGAINGYLSTASLVTAGFGFNGNVVGGNSRAAISGAGTLSGAAYGISSTAIYSGSGTLSLAYGYAGGVSNTGSGTITNAAMLATSLINSGGGSITNGYGLLVQAFAGATNMYGVYSDIASGTNQWNFYANGTANNYFKGRVGIGTTAPDTSFHVEGTPTLHSLSRYNSVLGASQTLVADFANGLTSTLSVINVNLAGFNDTNVVTGIIGRAIISGTGTLNGAAGQRGLVENTGNNTITFASSFRVSAHFNSGGGTITNAVGMHLIDQTVGTNNFGCYSEVTAGSNKYFLYDAGGAQSYFTGDVILSGLTASRALYLDSNKVIKTSTITDTQLTSLGYAGYSLKTDTTAVGNVGSGEDNLISYSIPSGTLSTNGDYIEFEAFGIFAANTNTKRIHCYFGATDMFDTGDLALASGGSWTLRGKITRTGATTQIAIVTIESNNSILRGITNYGSNYTLPGETLSGAITLKCTAIGTADDDISQKGLIVKKFPGA